MLTEVQEQVLTGLMLGDGHLSIGGRSINPRLRVNRAGKDAPYARWTAEVFRGYCTPKSFRLWEQHDRKKDAVYQRASLNTRRHPDFMPAFQRWYGGAPKALPDHLTLTPLVLAVWFADDGCIWKRLRYGKSSGVGVTFATCGFGREGSERLADLLNSTLEGGFAVYGGYKGARHFKIVGSSRQARQVASYIDPVFPPMNRKSSIWRGGFLDLSRMLPVCPSCVQDKVYRNGYYTGKGTERLARRFKCGACGHGWKVPL